MGLATLWLADAGAVLLAAVGGFWVGLWARPRWWCARRSREATGDTGPARPLEESVARARRLGRLHHHATEGRSHAKVEGVRRAYDEALAECCAALEVVHLLDVLAPGPELDAERSRVEQRLAVDGVDLHLTS
ncbi:MAG TPA: hypothetical protein VFM09_08170 [Marmoricola sp.]|nr:hypothetical protein [Marmoricola sp.]